MSLSCSRTLLLATLIVIALPSLAEEGRGGNHEGDGRANTQNNERYIDVPGWKLPANRVLPPVGYVARPLPGAQPAFGNDRRPARRWVRGVHYAYYGAAPTHVVRDHRGHGLRAPPRGYYWRGDGRGTYLLVDITSGVVAGVVGRGR